MSPRRSGIDEPLPRKLSRCVAFAGALALQLIFISVFVASGRIRSPPAPVAAIAMTQIVMAPATSNAAPRSAPALTTALLPVPATLTPAMPLLALPVPAPPPPAASGPRRTTPRAPRSPRFRGPGNR